MMDMMSGMGTMMLIGLLLLAIVIGLAVYLGIRATQAHEPREPRQLTARERLQHRLADGEITPDEYYEREAVLRDDERTGHKRRRPSARAAARLGRPPRRAFT